MLRKFNVGITVQQALDAKESEIVNGCLILKEEQYQEKEFEERKDFSSVLALRLRCVPEKMFAYAENLINVIMPEAVGAMYCSFYNTAIQHCFFPKLVRIGNSAF